MSRVVLEKVTVEYRDDYDTRFVDGRPEHRIPPAPLYRVRVEMLADASFIERLQEFFRSQGVDARTSNVPLIGKVPLLPEAKDIVHEAEIVDEPPRPRSRR